MTDHLDTELRAALRAEVDDAHAGVDLLERIQTATRHQRTVTRRDRAVWLLVAAALAGVVGYAATVLSGDGEDTITVPQDEPTTTPTTTTTSTVPIAPADRPALIALVREDGHLVTIDLTTGEERELAFHGDPRETDLEGGPYYIDGVDLSPDGQWVYYSTCCEPAVGTTYRVPTGGGEPERVADGAYPRLSADGRYLAVSSGPLVVLHTLDESHEPVTFEVASLFERQCCAGKLAWSPDGSQLAVLVGSGAAEEVPEAALLDWDGATLTPADTGKPDNPGSFISWNLDGMLTISSGGPIEDDRWLSQDASFGWLLWIDEEGVVLEQNDFEHSDRVPIDDLPEALAADW